MPYRRLDADKIVDTIQVLRQRVSERFPDAGLTRVCEELLLLAEGARVYRGKLGRPNFVLRFTAAAVIGAMAAGLVALVGSLEFKTSMREWPVLIQGLEAAVNELVGGMPLGLRRNSQYGRGVDRDKRKKPVLKLNKFAPFCCDLRLPTEDGLRRSSAKADNHTRSDSKNFARKPDFAGVNLVSLGLLVQPALPLANPFKVFNGVGDVQILSVKAGLSKRSIEQSSCRTDKRLAGHILFVARLLAYQH